MIHLKYTSMYMRCIIAILDHNHKINKKMGYSILAG